MKEILKYPRFQAVACTVDASQVAAGEDGRKVLVAGTIIGGASAKLSEDATQKVVKKNTTGAEGVLLYDVDVTAGDQEAAMLVRGDINQKNIPEEPTAEALADLAPMIVFWNN